MILVTGGLGYLGGRLSECLLQSGEKIRITSSRKQLDLPEPLNGCELIHMDLLNQSSVEKAVQNVKIVIHLASMNANDCASDPAKAVNINGLGSLNLLNAAARAGVKRFIYFSSIHVYGAHLVGKIDEMTIPEPSHPYSISRHLAEDFVISSRRYSQMDTLVLRLSNAVGSPLTKDANCWMLVAHDLCRQSVEKGYMTLHGSGKDLRNFISISDLLQIVKELVKYREEYQYYLLNVGGENSYSILKIAQKIASGSNRLLGFTPDILIPNKKQVLSDGCDLDYRSERLSSMCSYNQIELQEEIDNLLLFCQQEFTDV